VQRLGLPEIAALETSAFDEAAGHAAAQTLLTEHPRITGVVAGNDLIAVGIIVAASERGRNCPRDISVVGFNDMLPSRNPETVLLSGKLVVRGSTAPPPPAHRPATGLATLLLDKPHW
jgi:ABC-type sugar transport system substrate-binding protein